MLELIGGRVVQAVVSLVALSVIVFLMTHATGNPVQLLLPTSASPEDYANLTKQLGLDKPLPTQYLIYVTGLLHGNLGSSTYFSGAPVTELLQERLPMSLELAGTALVLMVLLGTPLGVISALNRGRLPAQAVQVIAVLGQAMPSFWLGILLIEIFAVRLGWLPAGLSFGPEYVILPAVALATFGVAAIARLLSSSLLEVLGAEFITLKRAQGLPERNVIGKHGLRNALLPTINFTGVLIVGLITQAITVETVFAWPGIGLLTYNAILNRDFPVVQGVTLFAGSVAILASLGADIAAMILDPRIRLGGH